MFGRSSREKWTPTPLHFPTCSDCVGACCRQGTIMELTSEEADQLQSAGTGIEHIDISAWDKRRKVQNGTQYYALTTDCGNLNQETYQCEDYANRPAICRDFSPGTVICRNMLDKQLASVTNLGMPALRAGL